MNTNQKALELFEQNEYEKALELFRHAAKESRNIQSLNNLAWMYSYEVEDDNKALVLVKEVIQMQPLSYFPYSLLGEIYLRQKSGNFHRMHFQSLFPFNHPRKLIKI